MNKALKRVVSVFACVALAFGLVGCAPKAGEQNTPASSPLDPANPTSITIWNYYNGDQLAAFDALVTEFNSTVGVEEGIVVNSVSQGSIENLASSLLESADGKVGAQDMPTLAAIYPETVYILANKDMVADLDQYFTAEELAAYIPGFIEEGRLTSDGPLYEFPVSKSTECFCVNETDWAPFEQTTGISIDSVKTFEDLTAAAESYYKYTDALTPDVANDGKALYGRDSVSNYMYIGSRQLGHPLFEVSDAGAELTLDKQTMRTLWDNYYVPYVNGYFTANAKYRSDDVKTGTIIAITSSTSSASYLPTKVTDASDNSHDITLSVSKQLTFAQAEPVSVQQGAGYCVLKSDDASQYAAAQFLKWLTDTDRNLTFSVTSGYSPVTTAANDASTIENAFKANESIASKSTMLDALLVSSDVYLNDETYACKPFQGSKDARYAIGDAMEKTSIADRAAVVEAMDAGQSREEAVAAYTSDAAFESWYANLQSSIEATLG